MLGRTDDASLKGGAIDAAWRSGTWEKTEDRIEFLEDLREVAVGVQHASHLCSSLQLVHELLVRGEADVVGLRAARLDGARSRWRRRSDGA